LAYSIRHIAEVLQEQRSIPDPSLLIEHLLTDSRRLVFPGSTLFFALTTARKDGAAFVDDLYVAGVRAFVVSKSFDTSKYGDANFILVEDALAALQKLATYHRSQFKIPVIGITGSNGKTIVKEWLFQLLEGDYRIVRSPRSYNSQIGVALSAWQMNGLHQLAIFEAGISEPGEMQRLAAIVQPTIGILTNIGEAHAAGFRNIQQKLNEKWRLFDDADIIICNTDNNWVKEAADRTHQELFNWSHTNGPLRITDILQQGNYSSITADYQHESISITVPFTDKASVENAITCWCCLLHLRVSNSAIKERMKRLHTIQMRLQLKKGINHCSIINDSYSNDLSSLEIALDFLQQQAGNQKTTVILSDLGDNGANEDAYLTIANSLARHNVQKFIGIGPKMFSYQSVVRSTVAETFFYTTVSEFILHFHSLGFKEEMILLKGARVFEFEQIDLLFEQQVHQTVLEINLTAMVHNLKQYQSFLKPGTKVMAMVKAFSYGSGTTEIASVLQFHKVDYLAVAYADEGVQLRKAGIQMPIMVMNPETITFQSLIQHNLEPEIYSFALLKNFSDYLNDEGIQQAPVHIKIDTGMHRLGFEQEDIERLCKLLRQNNQLVVKSVFSHLAASEDPSYDDFTKQQLQIFLHSCKALETALGYSFIKHISNSAAIFRHPHLQLDMVRLGIGLYGVDSAAQKKLELLPVATLRSTVAQVRHVKKGESVGYSRKGIMRHDGEVATMRIGYADGYNRRLGNGVGKVWVSGQLAPVIGNVCMDMTMVDVTGINVVNEGDSVEIFGKHISIEQVATWSETIAYEIMTAISQRVKRVYYEE
jgi:alanine racemase